jgi:hypothetical protein
VVTMFLLVAGFLGSADALDVQRSVEGEVVVVSAVLSHAAADVLALLAQHEATMQIGKETRHVETRPLPNGCTELKVVSRGFGRDMRYTAERCRTANGFRSKMIASEDFDAHDIWWIFDPAEAGTQVTIRAEVRPRVMAPHFLIQRFVSRALSGTLTKLNQVLERGQLAP